jgi:ubiquinone/menaquinone biosynthesis C-methylase UbiE
MARFFHDSTDLHLRYDQARALQPASMSFWMDSVYNAANGRLARTVVDLGCGTGRFTLGLRERFNCHVIGIDPSPRMLSRAPHRDRLTYLQANAEALPLADRSVDVIFMSMVWHHFQDHAQAGANIARVLRTGGSLCIRTSTFETLDTALYLCFFPGARRLNEKALPTRSGLIQWASRVGLSLSHRSTVQQQIDANLYDYAQRIGLRGLSDLNAVSDLEFMVGLNKLQQYCLRNNAGQPVMEMVDFFVFKKYSC